MERHKSLSEVAHEVVRHLALNGACTRAGLIEDLGRVDKAIRKALIALAARGLIVSDSSVYTSKRPARLWRLAKLIPANEPMTDKEVA